MKSLDVYSEYTEHSGMQFNAWDKLFNLILLVLWFEIWHGDGERRIQFNPYLAPIARLNKKLAELLRPVLLTPDSRVAAAVAFCVVLVFRAALAASSSQWFLRMGFFIVQPRDGSMVSLMLFSVLSFAIVVFQVWGICMIYNHGRRPTAFGNSSAEALHEMSRPFSSMKVDYRPPALLVLGMALAYILTTAGVALAPASRWMPEGSPFTLIICSFLSALAAWTDVLPIIRSLIIVLIIGSWVSMFTQSHALMMFCRDWLDFIIGPLRRYPLRLGPIDLTPIVMVFALELLHKVLMSILLASYNKLI